ncbi:MAG TPA: MFS transporter [Anaeromyxobacteraceae bacterium]|nr:MFS transporter [Anaeromyxobacteraceae bacterium]
MITRSSLVLRLRPEGPGPAMPLPLPRRDVATPARDHEPSLPARRRYYVFFLCFTLMLLDYMARQVVVAMFPVLKELWQLSDARLGSLVSIVSLAVGVLCIPLAVVADRFGRVRSIAIMAVVWSAATAAGALARSYEELLAARFLVGVGEAAYGAAGASLLASVFPGRQHSAAIGSFMSAALFGSVLGVLVGGTVGAHFGWQAGFWLVGLPGLVLAALFFGLRRDAGVQAPAAATAGAPRPTLRQAMATMARSRSIVVGFAANGVLVFVTGTLSAWLPTFFHRVYGLSLPSSGLRAALAILAAGVGSSLCGFLVDRLARRDRRALFLGPAGIAAAVALLLGAAFRLGPGPLQYALILLGSVGLAGTQGPIGSVIASLVHPGMRSTALATLAVVQNVIGLGAGALVTGLLSDRLGIAGALAVVPLAAVVASIGFVVAARSYQRDLRAAGK